MMGAILALGNRYLMIGACTSIECSFRCDISSILISSASINRVSTSTIPSGVSHGTAEAQVIYPRWLGPMTTNVPSKSGGMVEKARAPVSPE